MLEHTCSAAANQQTANVGGTVDFNCTVRRPTDSNENVTLSWNVDWWEDSGDIVRIECGEPMRTNMPSSGGSTNRGQYTTVYQKTTVGMYDYHVCILTVTMVTQGDAGSYACSETALSGNGSVSEDNVDEIESELSVVYCSSTPVKPNLSFMLMPSVGVYFNFSCNVIGSGKRDIRWVDGDDNEIIGPTPTPGPEGSDDESTLQLIHRVTPKDNGRTFYCEVSSPSADELDEGNTALCSVIPFRVFPNILLDLGSFNPVVTAGASISITCRGTGAAFIRRYEWFIGDKMIDNLDPNNRQFSVRTTTNLSESILTISNVTPEFNNTQVSCKTYGVMEGREDQVISTNSTVLFVQKADIVEDPTLFAGSGSESGNNNNGPLMTLPAVIIALCSTVALVVVITLVVFKRRSMNQQSDDKEKMADEESRDQKGSVYKENATTGQLNSTFDSDHAERRPSLAFLDPLQVSTGRRRSSLFRESFQGLWNGNGDGDDISNASSVSLPSFAAVSQSTRHLDTYDAELYSPTALTNNSHPPLSARASAPASFRFDIHPNVKEAKASEKIRLQRMQAIENDNSLEEADGCISEIPDIQGNGDLPRHTSNASNNSNLSIPTVMISSPPNSPIGEET